MAKQSSVNLDIGNNADGYDISGGTTARKMTYTGADMTLTGSGTATITFPATTSTLVAEGVLMGGVLIRKQGTDIASATNISLPTDGNVFELTGTTKVDLISNVGFQDGHTVSLIANESVVVDNGTATATTNITILLNGAADYSMTAGDTLTLTLCTTTAGGQGFREMSRSVN